MSQRLYINGFEVDLSGSISIPIDYSIADFKKPEDRKRTSSKTVVLEGTQNNKSLFSSAYQLSLTDFDGQGTGFSIDPTVRVEARLIKNDIEIFNGLAQLLKVTKNRGHYRFEIVLYSNFVNVFQTWGDLKVSELGWDEYDHSLTANNVTKSWSTTVKVNNVDTANYASGKPLGFGYWYPLIDFGYDTSILTPDIVNMRPYVYQREVLKKAFELGGLSIDSDFIDSDMFRALTFGFGGGKKELTAPSDVNNRRVNYSFDGTINDSRSFSRNSNLNFLYFLNKEYNLNVFSDSSLNDGYNQYDSNTGIITLTKGGNYRVNVNFDIDIFGSLSNADPLQNNQSTFYVGVFKNGVEVKKGTETLIPEVSSSFVVNHSFDLTFKSGDYLEIKIVTSGFVSYSTLNNPPTYNFNLDLNNNFLFDVTSLNGAVNVSDTMTLSKFIPDMKVSDFVKGVITMFNLYIDEQQNDNLVKIEPLIDFYLPTSDTDNWTIKKDNSKEVSIEPTNIEGKVYSFEFTEDLDYLKNIYKERVGSNYGDYEYEVKSTYQKGTKVFKVPFAQTCPVENNGLVIPRIVEVDSVTNLVEPYKGKPRIFFNNGLVSGSFSIKVNTTINSYTSYPQAHHSYGDFKNPTFDLNFATPLNVFYPVTNYGYNNIFNNYHRLFIREVTSRDSKVLTAYFNINENDIYEGMFRKLVNIDGVLYRKNIIKDFNATGNDTVKVELLKVIETNDPDTGTRPSTINDTILGVPDVSFGGVRDVMLNACVINGGIKDGLKYADLILG